METKVQWEVKAVKQLIKIDKRYIAAIKEKAGMLKNFPNVKLDIKHLNSNQYRFRHGDYRIFFELIDETPKIISIQKIARRTNRTYD